ncbi:L-galactose dehydrogenase-like [Dendronephthya gigantea]|uniref:L-galactose dehydrogenase-like n=1 Tax=Dendronephthya gigantea TaxID=151771 RepID=UPI001069D341|nr:L-galactose dehydrogenase-like [Dendronephthya gigantea]
MNYRFLGKTGMEVSILSFGASSLGSVFHSTQETESIKVVQEALKSGINYIDVAPWYGHGKAETVLGKALKDVPRDSYYLATKVGRYLPEIDKMFDFSKEKVVAGFEASLQRLGLDYVDVLQVHDMEFAPSLDIILNETLPAMMKLKEKGKVKFIGITGYPLENFRRVLEKTSVPIDTILSYCHCSMNDQTLLGYINDFKKYDVGIINASPISMGLLSNRGPPSWHPATQEIKNACKHAAEYCQRQGIDISKLAMKFSLGFDEVATTLVSTANIENLRRNIATVTEELSKGEKEAMEFVIENYFSKLEEKTWEGVEVKKYWENMEHFKST